MECVKCWRLRRQKTSPKNRSTKLIMKPVLQTIFVLIVSFSASFLDANEAGPARTELERFTTGLERFQADFTQTVKSQDGRVQDRTVGKVWLQNPDKLRWVYSGDFPETIVADGNNIWIYDESLAQVTVKPQSRQASDSPLMLLADISQIDQQFQVTELGDFEDMLLLELKSLDSESEFERILMGLGPDGISMMAMEDAFGQRFRREAADVGREPAVGDRLAGY